jgi:hypothetical protein
MRPMPTSPDDDTTAPEAPDDDPVIRHGAA